MTYRRCIQELRALEGVRDVIVTPHTSRHRVAAGDLRLVTDTGEARYACHVANHLSPGTLGAALARFPAPTTHRRPLLLADHVPAAVAETLVNRTIDYIDTAGNAHLRIPGRLLIDIRGRRPDTKYPPTPRQGLTAVGLHVLFVLLLGNGMLGPYRHIAAQAGTSAAGVARVVGDLVNRGFIVARRGHRRVVKERMPELLDVWARGYSTQLRPKLTFQAFRAPGALDDAVRAFSDTAQRQHIAWVLTGAFGADVLTQYLHGDRLTIIVDVPSTMSLPRWSPSHEGPITLLRSFSPLAVTPARVRNNWPAAHPLLVYAELLADGRSRELEAAKTVREQYLEEVTDGPIGS